jgi:hypothetical protein
MKITFRSDGVDKEVDAGSADHLKVVAIKEAQLESLLVASKTETVETQARLDAAVAQVAALTAELAAAPAKIAESVKARAALEAAATVLLGKDVRIDGLSDRDLRIAAIVKSDPKFVAADRSDEYVTARFDFLKETPSLHQTVSAITSPEIRSDAADAPDYFNKLHNAWKQPASVKP